MATKRLEIRQTNAYKNTVQEVRMRVFVVMWTSSARCHPRTCLKSCGSLHARVERQLRLEAAAFIGFGKVEAGWEIVDLAGTERAPSITPPVRTVVLPPS